MPPIQLTDEQQAAAAPVLPAASPSSDPNAPQPGLPGQAASDALTPASAAPAAPTSLAAPAAAPATGLNAQPAPQTFAQKLAASLNKNGPGSGPGSWARSLVGGAVDAISTGMGDAAQGMKDNPLRPGESGALAGVMNTLAARQQRIQQQNQQAQANALAQRREDRADMETQARIAFTQAQTFNLAKADQRADENERRQSAADGRVAAAPLRAHHEVLGDHITDSDLMAGATNGGIYDPHKVIAYPTLYELGADGVSRRTWTVFKRDAQPVTVDDPDTIALINKYGAVNTPLKPGQVFPNGDIYDSLLTQALSSKKVQDQIASDAREANIKQANEEQTLQHNTDTSALIPWFANHTGDPIEILMQAKTDVDPKTGKPTPIAQAATRELMRFKPEDLEKYQDHKDQEADKLRKQQEDEDVKNGKFIRQTVTRTDDEGNTIKSETVVPNPNYRPNNGNTGGNNGSAAPPAAVDTKTPQYQKALQIAMQHPDQIDNAPFSPEVKAQLKKDLAGAQQQQSQQQTAAILARHTPDQVVMQGDGGVQVLPNNPGVIANFIKTHPGYKNLGAGTQQVQAEQQFGVR